MRHNILLGDDAPQVRFMELFTGLSVKPVTTLADEDILGKEEPILFQVERSTNITLSPNVKAAVGIWSLNPLVKGSAGVSQIIKYAMALIGREMLPKGALERANEMVVELFPPEIGQAIPSIRDVRAGISAAIWVLTGDIPLERPPLWKRPWESATAWMPRGVDPAIRLHSLYRDIVGWTYMQDGDKPAGTRFGLNASRLQWLERQRPDRGRMDATFQLLSVWRSQRADPYVTALKISRIWARPSS